MRQTARILLLVAFALVQVACAKQATLRELRGFSHQSGNLFGGSLWYCGTGDEFHYFFFEELAGDAAYKLKKADLKIGKTFAPMKDRANWIRVSTRIGSDGTVMDGLDGL